MQPALCSCMAATFNEANSRLSIIGCLSGEICDLSELQLEIVDSVEDFRCLDSHKVMECLRRILSLDNFARSLVTEKVYYYFKKCAKLNFFNLTGFPPLFVVTSLICFGFILITFHQVFFFFLQKILKVLIIELHKCCNYRNLSRMQ